MGVMSRQPDDRRFSSPFVYAVHERFFSKFDLFTRMFAGVFVGQPFRVAAVPSLSARLKPCPTSLVAAGGRAMEVIVDCYLTGCVPGATFKGEAVKISDVVRGGET